MRTAAIFIISAVLTSALHAQNYQNRYPSDQRTTSSRSTPSRSVQQLNKTSTLVGTEVRTRSNEAVGEVKDVVIDFRSGRVAYIVVDANEMLDASNSLIAVSPRMLRPASGQQSLTLDADRNRIEELRTFSSNNYPAISGSSPQMSRRQDQMYQRNQWFRESPDSRDYSREDSRRRYSQFQNRYQDQQDLGTTDDDAELYIYEYYVLTPEFESPDENAYSEQDRFGRGAYGQSQSGSFDYDQYSQDRQSSSQARGQNRRNSPQSRGYSQYDRSDDSASSRSSSQYDRSQSDDYDYDPDRSTGSSGSYQSDQSRSNQQSSRSGQGSQQQTFYGLIQDTNYSNQTLTVEGDQRTLTFQLADQPRLQLNNRENGQFNHFHEGQWVRIEYRYEDGSNKAHSITETGNIDRSSRQ